MAVVSVDDCMKYTVDLLKFDRVMLFCRISESWKKHDDNERLTKLDKFLLGLRYSEFLAIEDSNEGYYNAELKRQACLRKLGFTTEEFNRLCLEICGLS